MVSHKSYFLEQFEEDIKKGSIKSICDFGSGLSINFIPFLKKYPELEYVGIEPSRESAETAIGLLKPFNKARVYNSFGYEPIGEKWGTFDLVISLSVLEHVKHLDRFMKNSVDATKSGGMVVHRWDLGHALYPLSVKERLQVWLGNNFPSILPEDKFVSLLEPDEVSHKLKNLGVKIERVTYHQMPNHKSFLKHFKVQEEAEELLIREMLEWEFAVSPYLSRIDKKVRLKLFPTISVWGRKP